jgi:hypothetical protein
MFLKFPTGGFYLDSFGAFITILQMFEFKATWRHQKKKRIINVATSTKDFLRKKSLQLCNSERFTKWKYEIYVHGLHTVKLYDDAHYTHIGVKHSQSHKKTSKLVTRHIHRQTQIHKHVDTPAHSKSQT